MEYTIHQIYKIGPIIGQGAFGKVRMSQHRTTYSKRAIKILEKGDMDEND
jgi:hypothetical protein